LESQSLLWKEMHFTDEEKENENYKDLRNDMRGFSVYCKFPKFQEKEKQYLLSPIINNFRNNLFLNRTIEWTGWVHHGSRSCHKDVDPNAKLSMLNDIFGHYVNDDGDVKRVLRKFITVLFVFREISMEHIQFLHDLHDNVFVY
jgi:hypothetical protein